MCDTADSLCLLVESIIKSLRLSVVDVYGRESIKEHAFDLWAEWIMMLVSNPGHVEAELHIEDIELVA